MSMIFPQLVNSHVKIQFEINSQHTQHHPQEWFPCEFSRKNTI